MYQADRSTADIVGAIDGLATGSAGEHAVADAMGRELDG